MTKREITSMSNAQLIVELSRMAGGYRVRKYEIEDANKVTAELAKRGVIENQEELIQPWLEVYTR